MLRSMRLGQEDAKSTQNKCPPCALPHLRGLGGSFWSLTSLLAVDVAENQGCNDKSLPPCSRTVSVNKMMIDLRLEGASVDRPRRHARSSGEAIQA